MTSIWFLDSRALPLSITVFCFCFSSIAVKAYEERAVCFRGGCIRVCFDLRAVPSRLSGLCQILQVAGVFVR